MPNIKSAVKRVKVAARNQVRNVSARSAVKTAFRAAREAVTSGAAEALAKIKTAASAIDKAVSKGLIHKNTAARKKSRLVRQYNALLKDPQLAAAAKAQAKPPKKEKKPAAAKTEKIEKSEKPDKAEKPKKEPKATK